MICFRRQACTLSILLEDAGLLCLNSVIAIIERPVLNFRLPVE